MNRTRTMAASVAVIVLMMLVVAQVGLTQSVPDVYEVSIEVIGQGQVTVNPAPTYGSAGPYSGSTPATLFYYESEITWEAEEITGWSFSHWEMGRAGNLETKTGSVATLIMSPDPDGQSPFPYVVKAYFEESPTYVLTVQIQGVGQVTPGVGLHTYSKDQTVTLVAQDTPGSGYTFDYWNGDVANPNAATTTITMDANKEVTAVFTNGTPTTFVLTVNKTGVGTVIPEVGQYVKNEGEVVQLQADPGANYTFDHWDGDVANPNAMATSITMNENKSVTAHFVSTSSPRYTLTMAVVGSGTTSPSVGTHTYDAGTAVPLTPTPDPGWVFDRWSGDVIGPVQPTSITMDGNKSVTAHFVTVPSAQYTLTVNTIGSGTVTKTPDKTTYQYGEVVSLDPTPLAGWKFVGWSGALSGSDDPATITMNSNRVVTAHFIEQGEIESLSDDVESGSGNWMASSLWHITEKQAHSPVHSWWFGDEQTGTYAAGDYTPQGLLTRQSANVAPKATGGRVQGTLTSGPISVTSWGETGTLSFWHWRHVEYYPDAVYDRTFVQVKFVDEAWQTVWAQDSRDASQQSWERVGVAIQIPPRVTSMWVRFVFDSVDGLNNGYPGWFIDDIEAGPPETGTVITVCPLVDGTVGQAYGPVLLGASGGVAPYTWSWTPAIPGLSLDQRAGTISGIPTMPGPFDVTITVVDAVGGMDTMICNITIYADRPCPCVLLPLESFDAATDWTTTGLWHVDSGLACVTCASLFNKYAYFGRPGACSYATGARVEGGLKSPTINIPDCVRAVVVEFDQYRYVECYGEAYDRTWLEASFDGTTWETLWYRDALYISPECSHVQEAINVPTGATQMWIRFRFDSVDRFYNDFPGWVIDNVEVLDADCVTGAPPPPPPASMIAPPKTAPRDQISVTNSPNPITDVHTTVFTVRGVNVEAMKIQIFDLSGALVYDEEVAGNELVWHTDSNHGEYLANGVYLYRALVKVEGSWITTSTQKLVILR